MVAAYGRTGDADAGERWRRFRGAVVGLGALGAITKVTLAIQPTYQVRQYVYENMPLAQMAKHFDEIQAAWL